MPAQVAAPRIHRRLLLAFALPAILQGFLHAPAQSILQGVYAKHGGVSLAALGTAVLIARIFDAVIDPFIGVASDAWYRRRGSHRDFIVAGTLLTMLGLWQLFQPPPDPGALYFTLWYMLASLGWSLTEIPYKSWGMQLSSEYRTRTRIQTWLALAGVLGTILFYLTPVIAKASGRSDSTEFDFRALSVAALLVALFMPLANLITLWKVPPGRVPEPQARLRLTEIANAVTGHRPLIYFTLMFLLTGIANGIGQGVNYLYIDSYLGLSQQLAGILLLTGPLMLVGIPIWGAACQRWERQKVWAVTLAAIALLQACYVLVPVGLAGLKAVTVLTLGIMLFLPCVFVAGPAMIGDLIDYGRWKFSRDHGGIYIAFFSVVNMTVAALGASLGLILLDALGYDPTAKVQTTEGIAAMKLVAAWIPAIGTALAVPFVWRYPLDRRRHAELLRQLDEAAGQGDKNDAASVGARPA